MTDDRPMRVLIFDQFAGAPDVFGFPRHYYLSRELAARGHDITVVTSNFNHKTRSFIFDDGASLVNGHEKNFDGVRFIWLPATAYAGNDMRRVLGMFTYPWRALQIDWVKRIGRPDVVLGSSPNLVSARGILRLARKIKTPFVMEVRDAHPDSLVELGGISPKHPAIMALRCIERQCYIGADAIVSVLPNFYEHLKEFGVKPQQFFHVPNGVDLSAFPDIPTPKHDTFDIMYSGAMGRANNLDRLVRAMVEVERRGLDTTLPVRLRLVGDGPKREALKALVAECNLSKRRVLIEPSVPHNSISSKLSEADAFVFLLMDSPLWMAHGVSPNKINDYLAGGRPTLTIISSANNSIQEAGGGVHIPGNAGPERIADAMLALAALDPAERAAMGQRARQAAHDRYSFPVLAEKLEQAFHFAIKSAKERVANDGFG